MKTFIMHKCSFTGQDEDKEYLIQLPREFDDVADDCLSEGQLTVGL
jgi:hypothetical protein